MSDSRPDYYALLGLTADADGVAIRAAYRALAKQLHPDMADDDESALASTEQFVRIQEAYDVLRDPAKRRQYDEERSRLSAAERAEREQRENAYRQALMERPAPITSRLSRIGKKFFSSPEAPGRSYWLYGGTLVIAIFAVGMYISQQLAEREKQNQILIVKVDPPRPSGGRGEPRSGDIGNPSADLNALTRELERQSREQMARVEAAKKRVEAEIENTLRAKNAPPPAPAPAPTERASKIDCKGEGRNFLVMHEKDSVSISYNGSPAVQPTVSDPGTGVIIMSKVEPTNRISIGFMKGDKNGTIVMIADDKGKVFRTVGVECNAAAF